MRLAFLGALLAPVLFTGALTAQYSATSVGAGCGPTLNVSFSPIGGGNSQVIFDLTGAWPNEHTLLFFGGDLVEYHLFGNLSCTFFVLPVWAHPDKTDGNGATSWSRSWPHEAFGSVFLQVIVYRLDGANLEFQLSNAVQATHT
jgi:hypothetical protein